MTDVVYCCGTGALSKLAIGKTNGTITRMDFIDFDGKGIVKTLVDGGSKAIRGTLDPIDTDVGEGLLFVRFRTRFYMTSAKMAALLPCLGFTASGNTWTLGDSLSESTVIVGPAGADEHTYTGCVPTDFVVLGQKGSDPVMIDIGWIGKDWATAANGTFFTSQSSPAMTEGLIYPFGDGANNTTTLTVNGGTTVKFPQIRMALDYGIISEYNNSVIATNLCPTRHKLTVATSSLYSTCDGTTGLFTTPMAGTITGGALVMNLATTLASGQQTQFTVANMKAVARPPRIVKNDFNRLPLNFEGYASGSTSLLVIVNQVNGG